VDQSQLPASLRDEFGKILTALADPPLFSKGPKPLRLARQGRRRPTRRKLKQSTIEQYRCALVTMVSALVADGVDIDSLTRVRDLVSPERLNQVLTFLRRRGGQRVTSNMLHLAVRARKLAEHCGLPLEELEQLDDIVAAVKEDVPRRRGMTPKNKAVIDRLDDQRFRDLVFLLPRKLVELAQATRNRLTAARLVRTAVAIELLLVCAMRRENLVPLALDKDIRKLGEGKNAFWVIDIAEHEVKNDEPLRYRLPTESAELLAYYLSIWRPVLCATSSSWLFPDADGHHIDEKTMTSTVKRASKRVLGVAITPHQFRHIAAELYLRENPGGLETVSQHLAHRDANTTRNYYARPKQREATRIYQDCVILKRSEAAHRNQRRGRRPTKNEQEGGAL
jgi:integrase